METLQALPRQQLREELLRCCLSHPWADAVILRMPFSSEDEARKVLDDCWGRLTPTDYLQAIAAHPEIGDKKEVSEKFESWRSGWLSAEQAAAAAAASETVLDEFSELNQAYKKKNGFIFLVCATGKCANEMLALLKKRLPNDRKAEIRNAVEEQRLIMQARFTRLLSQAAAPAPPLPATGGGGRGDTGGQEKTSGRSRL